MAKEGRSFFERLTGTVNVDDFDEGETTIREPERIARHKEPEPVAGLWPHPVGQWRDDADGLR